VDIDKPQFFRAERHVFGKDMALPRRDLVAFDAVRFGMVGAQVLQEPARCLGREIKRFHFYGTVKRNATKADSPFPEREVIHVQPAWIVPMANIVTATPSTKPINDSLKPRMKSKSLSGEIIQDCIVFSA
jgi:hypothetical protein